MSDLIQATSRTVKTMADGTLRLTVDISPIHAQNAFTLFGMPDAPVVLARLTQEAAQTQAQNETIEEDKPKGGFLSQWLAKRCKEKSFWEFLDNYHEAKDWHGGVECEADAESVSKELLGITSKTEIDNDKDVEGSFHKLIRLPYASWLAGKR